MAAQKANFKAVKSWGIGTFSQIAGFPRATDAKFQFVCPFGPSVVIWDIESRKRLSLVQHHSDLIVCMLKCAATKLILTLSYSGDGKILNENLDCVSEFKILENNVVYASWAENGRYFCICTIGPQSAVLLYEQSKDGLSINLVWSQYASGIADSKQTRYFDSSQTEESQTDSKDYRLNNDTLKSAAEKNYSGKQNKNIYKCYNACLFTDNDTVLAVFKQSKIPCEGHLLSISGELLVKQILSPFGEPDTSVMCLSSCKDNLIAVGLQRGIFMFINSKSLEMTAVFQTQGSSQVCLWDRETLLTASYQGGILQWWSDGGNLLKELTIPPIDSVILLNWSVPGKELWIGGIASLNYIFLESNSIVSSSSQCKARTELTLVQHRVAGCGLGYNSCATVASGDLAGTVIVTESPDMDLSQAVTQVNVKSSVRCLCWLETSLLIGTLDGKLFLWKPEEKATVGYKLLYSFTEAVLTVRKASKRNTFAVGTGAGKVYVFDCVNDNLDLKLEKQIHEPVCVDLGLGKRLMEIWSISWDPSDLLLVTASEDKTSAIMEASTGCQIAKLTGHTTAVTSVDWKQTCDGCIIATCGDDRTVRISDGVSFVLLKILRNLQIYGWYTFTYLAINPINNWILCTTQNGFVIVWDCVTMECLISKQMHCGSIEGLSWDPSFKSFATVGSDCAVNVFQLKGML